MLVSRLHAAGALAQAVGRAVGYDTTALLFIERDTATLSVVQTDDGSVVKVLSRNLHSADAMAVLADMAGAVEAQECAAGGLFVVGSGVDVSAVKDHLEHLCRVPVSAPEDPELALARGAALASRRAPADSRPRPSAWPTRRIPTAPPPPAPTRVRRGTQMAPVSDRSPRAPRWTCWPRTCPGGRGRTTPRRRGPQAVPAGGQRADVHLRGRRCGPGHLAGRQHPADRRPAAQPRRERRWCPSTVGARPGAPAPAGARAGSGRTTPPAETIQAPVPVVQEAPAGAAARVSSRSPRRRPPPGPGGHTAPAAPAPAPAPAAPAPAPGRSTSAGGDPAADHPAAPPPVFQPPQQQLRRAASALGP